MPSSLRGRVATNRITGLALAALVVTAQGTEAQDFRDQAPELREGSAVLAYWRDAICTQAIVQAAGSDHYRHDVSLSQFDSGLRPGPYLHEGTIFGPYAQTLVVKPEMAVTCPPVRYHSLC